MAYFNARRPTRRNRGMGALNCPGDPGCPGYVAPGSSDYQTSLLQEILANQQGGMQVPPGGNGLPIQDGGGSVTSWLNQNAGTVALAAGLMLFAFARGGR